MAGTEKKRIIELTEASTVQSGDFIAVDSNARGTKKVSTDTLATSAALTAETNARTGADEQMSERMDGIEEQTALIQNPTKTLSGALVSFTDGANMPMVACTAEIVPKQSGTGTPSPDNVRQISGWESVNLFDTGVNLWDEIVEDGNINLANGQNMAEPGKIRAKNFISVKPSTQYYKLSSLAFWNVYYDENKNFISYSDASAGSVFTTPSNAHYLRFYFETAYGTTYKHDTGINYPSTDHDYHAYTGTTTPVNLGRTVYGGTLDVVSGVLTVDRAMVDLGTLEWRYGDGIFSAPVPNFATPSSYPERKEGFILSVYSADTQVSISANAMTDGRALRADGRIYIKDTRYTDATAFKSAVSGQQLCYELATPQTYTLTGQEVSTLLGDNNVWADSGDVEITYRRDISIVLENLENALNGSNSLNAMMMSAPTENTAEEPTADEAEDDMR